MNIEEALQREDTNIRVLCDDKWLVWWGSEWLVLNRPYGKRNNRCLYSGESLAKALETLIGEA